jgi:hypothetical protein
MLVLAWDGGYIPEEPVGLVGIVVS